MSDPPNNRKIGSGMVFLSGLAAGVLIYLVAESLTPKDVKGSVLSIMPFPVGPLLLAGHCRSMARKVRVQYPGRLIIRLRQVIKASVGRA